MTSYRNTNKLDDVARFIVDNRDDPELSEAVKQVDQCNDEQAKAKLNLYRSCILRLARMLELYEGGLT